MNTKLLYFKNIPFRIKMFFYGLAMHILGLDKEASLDLKRHRERYPWR